MGRGVRMERFLSHMLTLRMCVVLGPDQYSWGVSRSQEMSNKSLLTVAAEFVCVCVCACVCVCVCVRVCVWESECG